ncbi:MAG: hypothetical protein PW789_08370 [Edaphobacter sp.]|uniref:hypothetical protein n=1 Tax=Edaphobacter sp. TaxID=1934404 RepID=UPI0023A6FE03|nr:hypothetical protein [Edaphobacter sp.]MDE1176610.1 hypothetical protein [Edaphobacter sp.]
MPFSRGASAPSRAAGHATKTPEVQEPAAIAIAIEEFLALHPKAVVLEDGRAVFEMQTAKYSLTTEHGRCTLQLWSEAANLVRRVVATRLREGVLRMSVLRFGQSKPTSLELVAHRDRRTPSDRESLRTRYLRVLERVLQRGFHEWTLESVSSAMDLEKSFGPAYARGRLVQGQRAWALVAVNEEETQATIDGALTVGILWLDRCRTQGDGRRVWQGLKVIVPHGTAALLVSRMAWLNEHAAQWELWELDQQTEELTRRDPADYGNLATQVVRAPNHAAVRERFADAANRVMMLVPEPMRNEVEQVVRGGNEIAFLRHGLEFARVRAGYAGTSFNMQEQITVGAGANETPLATETEPTLREFVARLFERRRVDGDKRDPLFRMQTERWLESVLRRNVTVLDEHLHPEYVYTQVPAFAAGDRGMLDLLGVLDDGRLAVIELKAEEDLQLALQGLDYWVRVRWHHRQTTDDATRPSYGLGEFQRLGYFDGAALSQEAPKLYLVAPALRVHPATEIVLRYLSPQVEWELVGLDERWRQSLKPVWRKRSSDPR